MTRSPTKIYLEAARMVAEKEEEFSCLAVKDAAHFRGSCSDCPEVRKYIKVFDLSAISSIRIEAKSTIRSLRVLMLCLMAACWRDFRGIEGN